MSDQKLQEEDKDKQSTKKEKEEDLGITVHPPFTDEAIETTHSFLNASHFHTLLVFTASAAAENVQCELHSTVRKTKTTIIRL